MAVLWSIITSKLAGPIALAVSLALGCFLMAALVTNGGLKAKVSHLTNDLAVARANYARCQANEATLSAAITVQNAAVDRLKAEDAQRAKDAARAVSDAHRATMGLRERADRVGRQVSRDVCGDDLIMESLR